MASPNTISFSFAQNVQQAVGGGIPGSTSYFIARVKYVLLDDSDKEKFDKLGGWKAIGSVECVPFINFNNPNADPIIARPLSSNYTQYPLINEVVLVKTLVSKKAQNNLGNYDPEFYYTDIISVWNAPEHNAVPDASYFKQNQNDTSVTGKFTSLGDLRRLIKAPGDFTVEGRRGGSIRLGSNTPGFNTPWTAASSKPILVVANNPEKVADSAARFENINKDGSTLMMMSGHNVGFVPASTNFDSYSTTVTISEKNNYVVVDQKPQTTGSLAIEDAKAVPTDVTGSLPVSSSVPPPNNSDMALDEEQLPEREDLQEIDVIVEEIEVSSLGTSGIIDFFAGVSFTGPSGNNVATGATTVTNLKSKAAYINSLVSKSSTLNDPQFKAKLQKLADDFKIKVTDLQKVITVESAGKYEKAVLWYKKENGKVKQSNVKGPGYEPQAAGLIQFTNVSKSTIGVNSLYDVINSSAIKQLDYVRKFFEVNRNRVFGADIYALYGTIFYPYIVDGGRITKPDNFILGSQKSSKSAVDVGKQNRAINGGNPISVLAFKRYVDSIFK